MAYGYFKILTRRRAFDKIIRDKAFSIAKNTKYDGYHRGLASMVYKFFDKQVSKDFIKTFPTYSFTNFFVTFFKQT